MVNGMIVEKKKMIKYGFDFTVCNYKAEAYFSDGSCLRGVSVLEN